jgi:hypothetical protein
LTNPLHDAQSVLQTCREAMQQLPNARRPVEVSGQGELRTRTAMSKLSWGGVITAQVRSTGDVVKLGVLSVELADLLDLERANPPVS